MPELIIKTIGEVTFSSNMKLEEGYRYDIPFDNLMLPYLPIAEMLRKEGIAGDGVKVGFAHPEGYRGYIFFAREMLGNRSDFAGFIKRYFTNVHVQKEDGSRIRTIKAGMTFRAFLRIPKERRSEAKKLLTGRKKIGITTEDITGEVELSLVENSSVSEKQPELSPRANYVSLDYSAMLLTPTCFEAPFSDGDRTYPYVPGTDVLEIVRTNLSGVSAEELASLRCTNAYIGESNRRLLPVPACVSVVKLDKSKMRYRLAPGRDPNIVEQDVQLTECYSDDFQGNLLTYTTPETEHIVSAGGEMYDALTSGQVFGGRIYGNDAVIRKLVSALSDKPFRFIGTLSEEGYGEVYLNITKVSEEEIPAEVPARSFDICCVSDVYLLGDDGMPACRAEDLLEEIEYILGCPGKLELEGRYINICKDFTRNPNWGEDCAVTRCLAKGSVIRVKTSDGEPVDIFPLLHCFVGERTNEGYGELMAYPARGQYYRLAESHSPSLYEINYPLTSKEVNTGATFARSVSRSVLQSRIKALAFADREEWKRGVPLEKLIPKDLLILLKEQFAPSLPEEKPVMWYKEALEGNDDGNPD